MRWHRQPNKPKQSVNVRRKSVKKSVTKKKRKKLVSVQRKVSRKTLPSSSRKRELFDPQLQTPKVAQLLLGALLIHDTPQGTTAGRIVETEAYLFKNDPACHAHRGQTKRNAVMFGPAGRAYVYLCYGMYELFNVVTNREGVGEAVLIRALEPLVGIEIMQKRRRQKSLRQLCSGPGKLVQAMGIKRQQSGQDLSSGNLRIELPRPARRQKITRTKRIGITQGAELNLRYYLSGSEFVSAV